MLFNNILNESSKINKIILLLLVTFNRMVCCGSPFASPFCINSIPSNPCILQMPWIDYYNFTKNLNIRKRRVHILLVRHDFLVR